MLGARLPNLAALRLGERDDDDDEADVGAPTPWSGDLLLGTGRPGGTPNVFDSRAWMQATANFNFDPSAPPGEYVKLMNKMESFAFDQLDVVPKYVFLVDGENAWRAHTGSGGSEMGQKLDAMFNSVIELERRDLDLHLRLRGCPEWRQPTALFVFTSKHAQCNPLSPGSGGTRVDDWFGATFSDMMRQTVRQYMFKFGEEGAIDPRVQAQPRAVACQMHIHVQTCKDRTRGGPCQDIQFRTVGKKSESVCRTYDHHRQADNRAAIDEYAHAYCEFDDLVVGRLYEAATQSLVRWGMRAELGLREREKARTWPPPPADPEKREEAMKLGRYNRYRSIGETNRPEDQSYWEDAKDAMAKVSRHGGWPPRPTPFMVTRDPGIPYQQLHSTQENLAMLHVNWE